MKVYYIFLLILSTFSSQLNAQKINWIRQISSKDEHLELGCMQANRDGTMLISGTFEKNISIQNQEIKNLSGKKASFLAQFGEDGKMMWLKCISSDEDTRISAIETDGLGNWWVAGNFTGALKMNDKKVDFETFPSVFVLKLSEKANLVQKLSFPVYSSVYLPKCALEGNGNLLVCGQFKREINFLDTCIYSAAETGLFVASISNSTKIEWLKVFNTTGNIQPGALSSTLNGNIYLSGIATEQLDYGTGQFLPENKSAHFLMYLDNRGETLWIKALDFINATASTANIVADYQGNCFLAASFKSKKDSTTGEDFFVAKYLSNGDLVWKQKMGGKGADEASAVTFNSEGAVLAGGIASADSVFLGNTADLSGKELEAFLVNLDKDGNQIWSERSRGIGLEQITFLKSIGANQLAFAGVFNAKDFKMGDFGFPKTGKQDIFIGQLDIEKNPKLKLQSTVDIFPNPSKGIVYYSVSKKFPGKKIQISIGKKNDAAIYNEHVALKQSYARSFNLSNQLPGVYQLTVTNGKEKVEKRVIIE